jgi:hypothetical protein
MKHQEDFRGFGGNGKNEYITRHIRRIGVFGK